MDDELSNWVDTSKDQRQNIVWNPRGSKSSGLVAVTLLQKSDGPHRKESMETSLHGESDAGASKLNFRYSFVWFRGWGVLIILLIILLILIN